MVGFPKRTPWVTHLSKLFLSHDFRQPFPHVPLGHPFCYLNTAVDQLLSNIASLHMPRVRFPARDRVAIARTSSQIARNSS